MVLSTLSRLATFNPYVLAVGLLTMGLLLAVRSVNRKLPAELVAVGGGEHLRLDNRLVCQPRRAPRRRHGAYGAASIAFHVPKLSLHEWESLAPSAFAVAIFTLVEAISIAKAVGQSAASSSMPRANLWARSGIARWRRLPMHPSSGSPSRTAVNYASGAQTRLAGVLAGLIVLLGLVVFGPLLAQIPYAALSGSSSSPPSTWWTGARCG